MQSRDDSIVFICQLDGLGGGQLLDETPAPTSEDLWVHLQSDHPSCAATMQALGLSEFVTELMTAPETRPRVVAMEGGVVIVLRGVNMAQDADPEDMVSLRIWLHDRLIITARKSSRRLMSIQDMRANLESGRGPRDTAEFLVAVVERLADRIGEVVEQSEEQLEAIEDDTVEMADADLRHHLTGIRRRAAQLKRYLAPQRDALDALYRIRSVLSDEQAFALREQTDRTTRYVEDLDLTRERAMLLQEEFRSRIAEQQNQRMYVLSLVTAIFLPLSFLTGVFGMNVMGLPGVENPWGFVWVAGSMLALAVLAALWFRLKKWL